jgi:hypothetical protein
MKNKNLILSLNLLLISLISIVFGLYYKWIFEIRFYLGLSLLLFSILAFLKFKRFSNYLFGIVLLLGLIDIIHFTPFSFGISFFQIGIQLIPFLFIVIFCVLNLQKINSKLNEFKSTSDSNNLKKNEIEFFKNQFKKLSETEIDKKLKEDLVPEAIEALIFLKNNLCKKDPKLK